MIGPDVRELAGLKDASFIELWHSKFTREILKVTVPRISGIA